MTKAEYAEIGRLIAIAAGQFDRCWREFGDDMPECCDECMNALVVAVDQLGETSYSAQILALQQILKTATIVSISNPPDDIFNKGRFRVEITIDTRADLDTQAQQCFELHRLLLTIRQQSERPTCQNEKPLKK